MGLGTWFAVLRSYSAGFASLLLPPAARRWRALPLLFSPPAITAQTLLRTPSSAYRRALPALQPVGAPLGLLPAILNIIAL